VKKRIQFPLFEVMMIVIMFSIMAILALPKFVDVGIEARIKTLNGVALNISSVNRLLYSRALIKGVQNKPLQATDILGEKDAGAYLVYGELRAQEDDLKLFLDNDVIQYSQTNKQGEIRLFLDSFENDKCYLDYYQAKEKLMPNGQTAIVKASYKIKRSGC
jgi:Tfp pilus assembly protein FimT